MTEALRRAGQGGLTSAAAAVLAGLDDIRLWQEDLYRDLHRHAELSHPERATARKVAERLGEAGYRVRSGVSVVGVLANGDGPTVLLRADMDALPVREATGLPYSSTETAIDADGNEVPVAHGCGHDMHVACLLGAAHLLAAGKGCWSGTVVALFQPAEESGDGARGMVQDDLAAIIPPPDVAFAQHVPPPPAGGTCTRSGPVQTVISREVPPAETAVLTVGSGPWASRRRARTSATFRRRSARRTPTGASAASTATSAAPRNSPAEWRRRCRSTCAGFCPGHRAHVRHRHPVAGGRDARLARHLTARRPTRWRPAASAR